MIVTFYPVSPDLKTPKEYTVFQLAQQIESEGKLGQYHFCNSQHLRCVIGVWAGHRYFYHKKHSLPQLNMKYDDLAQLICIAQFLFGHTLTNLNDQFKGTPEQRAKFMASVIRQIAWHLGEGDGNGSENL